MHALLERPRRQPEVNCGHAPARQQRASGCGVGQHLKALEAGECQLASEFFFIRWPFSQWTPVDPCALEFAQRVGLAFIHDASDLAAVDVVDDDSHLCVLLARQIARPTEDYALHYSVRTDEFDPPPVPPQHELPTAGDRRFTQKRVVRQCRAQQHAIGGECRALRRRDSPREHRSARYGQRDVDQRTKPRLPFEESKVGRAARHRRSEQVSLALEQPLLDGHLVWCAIRRRFF